MFYLLLIWQGDHAPRSAIELTRQRRVWVMENDDKTSKSDTTEWTCSYCPSVATTIRQGSAVCYFHATQLRTKLGLAERSEERRVGKECRGGEPRGVWKKKKMG